jgi:hypothetical protein
VVLFHSTSTAVFVLVALISLITQRRRKEISASPATLNNANTDGSGT